MPGVLCVRQAQSEETTGFFSRRTRTTARPLNNNKEKYAMCCLGNDARE